MINTSLVDYIYDLEKEKIVNREFRFGQKIDLKQKSKEYGVSITPIMQVFNRLIADGLVTKELRKGCFIRKISIKEIKELYDVRKIIEIESLKLFIEVDRKKLDELLSKANGLLKNNQEINHKSTKKYIHFEKQFHQFIVQNSNNQIFFNLYDSIFPKIQISQNIGCIRNEEMKEHIKIINNLLVSDFKKAIENLDAHIENCKQKGVIALEKYFSNSDNNISNYKNLHLNILSISSKK